MHERNTKNQNKQNSFIRRLLLHLRRLLLHPRQLNSLYVRFEFSFSCKHSSHENIKKKIS